MKLARRRRSLLEMALVIVIVGSLSAAAIPRLLGINAEIERLAVERVITNLEAVARREHARLLMAGEVGRLGELDGSNPVLLWQRHLDLPLTGYDEHPDASPAAGSWWFDAASGLLHYRVRAASRFQSEGPAGDLIRLRLTVDQQDAAAFGGRVRIQRVDRFSWRRSRLVSAAGS